MMRLMARATATITWPNDDVITAPLHKSVSQTQTLAEATSYVLVLQPVKLYSARVEQPRAVTDSSETTTKNKKLSCYLVLRTKKYGCAGLVWAFPQLPLLVRSHSKFPERCRPLICSFCQFGLYWLGFAGVIRERLLFRTFKVMQYNSAFHPFRVDKWVVGWNYMSATSVWGNAIWWTLTK